MPRYDAESRDKAIQSLIAECSDRYYAACADAPRNLTRETPLNRALIEVTRAQAFRLTEQVETSARHAHRETLLDAAGHLGAALTQSLPSDNQIILGHVGDARELILNAVRNLR